ncbi:monodehydroascorbate reductase 4, peroxisomal-like isoform X2 [Asparagus officinalis]|uniref:monodehydroascorbate reductase 4, peroxisomal-like isoform X1 n=1 Tax=Asparagus officinalis TaxID=4686 RepID=UPI00098E273B|nr:monodehydroascorbate reductase 4, peroxisomal-like isoform X1 [Asparagus officinalis]XP_020269721.1 monodehydroascorbate reductase 4, peroxisomal-like isoform X2 [Asparagus officinalis]
MARAFVYVILGGGVAAGYAALEFSRRGISHGELCIISEESVAPYERPALSKGYLLPEAPARLPYFHTCVGAGEQRLTPEWYKEHGIELILETTVKSANVKQKTLTTENGETISYRTLIIATGARALKLEEFGVRGSNAEKVCYLRNLNDADRLVDVMKSCVGGNAVVIGGGYIGMECTAALVTNRIKVTMVFPGAHCMVRLFTQKIASFYEGYYESKGVKFIKGTVVTSFENDSEGKVTAVILKDGTRLPTDMVVVGIGSRANTSLFEDQLTIEKGGIKVNNLMQTSNSSVYAVGDVAAFPVKLFNGDTRRLEHVDSARKTARHAVAAIMGPRNTSDLDYVPFFYSRVFTLAWQFYGDNIGDVVHYGDFTKGKFGAYWVNKGRVVGAFLEGGAKEEYEAIARVVKLKATVKGKDVVEGQGIDFALRACQRATPVHNWRSVVGVAVAVLMFAVAFRYGRRMF